MLSRVAWLSLVLCVASSAGGSTRGYPALPSSTATSDRAPPPSPPLADDEPAAKREKRRPPNLDPSLEELEGTFLSVRESVGRAVGAVRRLFHANRQPFLAAGGVLGLLHGGRVAFTVLFVQSFGASGWPLVRDALRRGAQAYEEAKGLQQPRETAGYRAHVAPLRKELVALAEQLAALRREGGSAAEQRAVIARMRRVREEIDGVPVERRATPVLVAAFEPAVVRDVFVGLWTGVTVSLATACSSACRTVGIGVTLGEVVSKAATAALAALEPALRTALSRLPAEAVMLSYLGPSIVGSATLGLLGRSVGCWVAYRLQHLAAVLSVSLLSARMLIEAVAPSAALAGLDLDEQQQQPAGRGAAGVKGGGGGGSDGTASAASPSARALAVLPRGQPRAWCPPWRVGATPRREAIAWCLAVASVRQQRLSGFRLPLALRVVLLPLLGVEALLRQLASQLTAKGFDAPPAAGKASPPPRGRPQSQGRRRGRRTWRPQYAGDRWAWG